MRLSWTRIMAILVKELRDYRRNRFVVVTMIAMPALFMVLPVVELIAIPVPAASARFDARIGLSMIYMLLIPAVVPSALSAYSIVGERDQGTLEPVLITPIRSEELLVGKALAALAPTLVIAYFVFGVFLACCSLFADAAVVSAVFTESHLLVQFLFTPLIAGWAIWVGIAISSRSRDVRAAQQLAVLASLPPLAVVALMSFNVIAPSLPLALILAAVLLVIDGFAGRALSAMFDRERLLTGSRE